MKPKMDQIEATSHKLSRTQVGQAIAYLIGTLGHFPFVYFDVREVYADGELKSYQAVLRICTSAGTARYAILLTDEDLMDMVGSVHKQLSDRAAGGAELLLELAKGVSEL